MYFEGQIIYDLDKKQPVKMGNVWDTKSYPKHHTHFIIPTGRFWQEISEYKVFSPKTIAEAKLLLKLNKIAIAPKDSMQDEQVSTIDVRRVKHVIMRHLEDLNLADLYKKWGW